jgi:hypothetical protein
MNILRDLRWSVVTALLCPLGLAAIGCSSDGATPRAPDGGEHGDASAHPDGGAPYAGDAHVPEAFEEALPSSDALPNRRHDDVVAGYENLPDTQRHARVGDRVYTLARNTGLTIVSAADPMQLTSLGHYRHLTGAPYELDVRGDVAIVLQNELAQHVEVASGLSGWVKTGKLLMLDVKDPGAIQLLAQADVPGQIVFTHFTADTLYIVSKQDGLCWGCVADEPGYSVFSFDLRPAERAKQRAALHFAQPLAAVAHSERRLYIASPDGDTTSIQVVDISAADGALTRGARLSAPSGIDSATLIDERDDVLRVVAPTRGDIHTRQPSRVATYRIDSSQALELLGDETLDVSLGEPVRQARFAGQRGYLALASALVVFDVSDPATPKVVGQQALAGTIQSIEPLGERVLVLHYGERLTLSLLNVADPTEIATLSSVDLPPPEVDITGLPLHVSTENNLIFAPGAPRPDVPWSWAWQGGPISGYSHVVAFANDQLSSRGSVWTGSRRPIVRDDQLLGASETELALFELQTSPSLSSRFAVSRNLVKAAHVGEDRVLRANRDVGLDTTNALELTSLGQLEDFQTADTTLPSRVLTGMDGGGLANMSVRGDRIFGERSHWDEPTSSWGSMVIAMDAADLSMPTVGRTAWGEQDWDTHLPAYWQITQDPYLWRDTFALKLEWEITDEPRRHHTRARVIDLRDISAPSATAVELPDSNDFYQEAVVSGAVLLASRRETRAAGARGAIFAQRVDLSDPSAPETRAALAVPGVVLHYDAQHQRALTLQTVSVQADDLSDAACDKRFVTREPGACNGYTQHIHLVDLSGAEARIADSFALGEHEWVAAVSGSDEAVFVAVGRRGYFVPGSAEVTCDGACKEREPVELLSLRGFGDGDELEVGRLSLAAAAEGGAGGAWGVVGLRAFGQRVLLLRDGCYAAVVDAADARAPKLVQVTPVRGPVKEVDIRGDSALLTFAHWGVQALDLTP